MVSALHFARQALRMSDRVTLYTNGNELLAKELATALDGTPTPTPMTVEPRKIARLAKGPERAQVTIHFLDGDDSSSSSKTEAFLAHKPKTKLRSSGLARQLGLELLLAPTGTGTTVKVSPPFNQTSVRGVFAAGDCATPLQTVTAALYSGTCAGGGAPLQIQAETYNQPALF